MPTKFGPFTTQLFSKCKISHSEISATAQSQTTVLREAQPCEVCTFNPSCLCHYTVQYKYDFVQNIPNLATVMCNLWLNCWLRNSTRVGSKQWTNKRKPKWIKKQLLQYWTRESSQKKTGQPKPPLFSFKCSVNNCFQNQEIVLQISGEKTKD